MFWYNASSSRFYLLGMSPYSYAQRNINTCRSEPLASKYLKVGGAAETRPLPYTSTLLTIILSARPRSSMHRIYLIPSRGLSNFLKPRSYLYAKPVHGIRVSRYPYTRQFTSYSPNTNSTSFHPSNRLFGRTCMITGGSSGIGFAIAERFLQEGVGRVILVGRSHERLVRAATQLARPNLEDSATTQSNNTDNDKIVATRTPEEDQALDQSNIAPGTLIPSSNQIDLLVGDVSEVSTWTRELENAMVCVMFLFVPTSHLTSPATGRHPHQCSWYLNIQRPPQDRSKRHLTRPPHKS